jgi:PPOX class probable F420-dependent enzyme
MSAFEGRYLSLTSFRRDGTGVATPVWFVVDGKGHILVETDARSFKVKRIRRDAHVQIALCDARGRPRGQVVDADARILSDAEHLRAARLLRRKYPVAWRTLYPVHRLLTWVNGRGSLLHEPSLALDITPTVPSARAQAAPGSIRPVSRPS